MIKKIYYDKTDEEDLNNFINNEEAQKIIGELQLSNENYFIGVDIASKGSKDYSCINYFKKNKDNNLIWVGRKFI